MGYTHYYTTTRSFTQEEWAKIMQATEVAIAKAKCAIRGSAGVGEPEITNDFICFNGTAWRDNAHEDFDLPREADRKFRFCKTARKPYDACVVEVLRAVKRIAPDAIELNSDGGKEIFG